MQRVLAHRVALGFVIAGAALGGCEEEAPRFDAPHASGVLTLPLRESQRFDAKMTTVGLYAALQGSHASIEVGSLGESRKVLLAHVPKGRFEPVMLGVENTALNALIDGGYTLVIGSGFVSVFDPVSPLGLLQLNGEVVSEVTPHGYTRILGVSEGMLRIIGRADYHPGLFESAIQVGPGVVEGGKLDIRPGERELQAHIRAFVTTCEDRWLVGVAQEPMHLYDVGSLLVEMFEEAGLACDEVVNLSGDREALLALRSDHGKSIAYFGNPRLPKASVVAFRELQ